MAGLLAGVALRYVAQRVGGYAVKTVAKQYGKRTSRQRMKQVAARRGGTALAPAPQGPYHMGHRISSCLAKKRTVERSVNPENVRMQCGKVKAVIEKDEYSEKMRIVKILEDKYDSSGYTK